MSACDKDVRYTNFSQKKKKNHTQLQKTLSLLANQITHMIGKKLTQYLLLLIPPKARLKIIRVAVR